MSHFLLVSCFPDQQGCVSLKANKEWNLLERGGFKKGEA